MTSIPSQHSSVAEDRSYSFPELSYRGRNDWWRYVLSFALLIVSSIAFTLWGLMALDLFDKGDMVRRVMDDPTVSQDLATIDAVIAFVFLLWTIISALIPFALFVPWIHGRPLSTFIFTERFNWHGFRLSLEAALIVPGSFLLFGLVFGVGGIAFQFQPGPWLVFVVVSLILIPVQILAEEIVFRGYLLQMIGRSTRLFLLRLLLPALVFAALHFANQEVVAGGSWALACYFALSVYLGFLVLWGNGLEYALGFHLGNNLFVALIVSSVDSTFGTPTLFKEPAPNWDASTLVLTIVALCLHFGVMALWRRATPLSSARHD